MFGVWCSKTGGLRVNRKIKVPSTNSKLQGGGPNLYGRSAGQKHNRRTTERNRQRSRVPLFYPDGGKTVQLRHSIRDTLKHPIDRRRFPGTNESIDLDSMEHWNKDGGSRVLVTDRTERHSSSSASTSTKKGKKATMPLNKHNRKKKKHRKRKKNTSNKSYPQRCRF